MSTTKVTCPAGKYGLAAEPWTPGEVYAVCANWAQASDQVLTYHEDGHWVGTGRQVADFRHLQRAALVEILRESLVMGGEDSDEAEEEASSLADDAWEIDDGEQQESPYTLVSTESGYAVRRADGTMAEFLDSDEADAAKTALDSGEASEDDYQWQD